MKRAEPVFATNGAGAGALQFIHDAYAAGLIDPGSIGLTVDQVHQEFTGGNSAVMLAAWPSSVNDSKSGVANSNIVGDNLLFAHEPGEKDDKGGTIALAEALAIPSGSKNKEAAAMDPELDVRAPTAARRLPGRGHGSTAHQHKCAQDLLMAVYAANNAMMGPVLQILPTIEPAFPGGLLTWYTKFSAEAAASIQRRCARPRHCSSGSR